MKNVSVMAIATMGSAFYKYRIDKDLDELKDLYGELLDMIAEAGYCGADVFAFEVECFGWEYVLKQFSSRGLKVSSYIFFSEFANADKADEIYENSIKAVDIAQKLGANVFMLVPQAHIGIENMRLVDIRNNLIKQWKPIVEYSSKSSLKTVIEDTPNLKLCLCRAEDVKVVLDAIPSLYLVYDSANMILENEDPVEYLYKFKDRIGYVHIKDMAFNVTANPYSGEYKNDGTPMCAVPTGKGLIDLKNVFNALKDIGYCGGITVEFSKDKDLSFIEAFKHSREVVLKYLNG